MRKIISSSFIVLSFFIFLLPNSHSETVSKGVLVLSIEDEVINPVISEYILNGIDRAEKENYDALLIKLDTPGGLLNSTRIIVTKMMNADVPILVYVSPSGARAGSAGVFITLASHIAGMAPSTNIGAAHPVSMGGRSMSFKKIKEKLSSKEEKENKEKEEEKEPAEELSNDAVLGDKVLNDTVAWVTGIAESRKRNVDWAVRSVKDSISSTAEEAKKAGVVEYVAKDVSEFLLMAEGSKVKLPSGEHVLSLQGQAVVESPLSFRQQILNVLVNPNIAYILMMLGFYGLLFEVTHPGAGFPGVAGAVSLILALYAFHTLPTNYAGMALIALSLVLFIAEVKVTSYGFLALGGIICLSLGSLFLIDTPYDFMKVSLSVILPTVLSTAFIFLFLTTLVVKAQSRGVMGGIEGMIGHVALADTDLSPTGKVFIDGEIWDAQSLDGQAIAKGDKVVIASQDGMMLNVRKS